MSYPVVEEDRVDSLGQVVSLEGDIQTIITQLRLLPPSPRVLTLPPFARSLSRAPLESESDARGFILQAHRSFTQRCEQARHFLLSSPSDQPRLVLMNGGCVSAKRICISKIAEELAGGNVEEGEQIFNELVSLGVAGLERPTTTTVTTTAPPTAAAAPEPVDVHNTADGETGYRSDRGRSFQRPGRYVEGEYDELVQPPVDSDNNFLEPSAEDYAADHSRYLKPFAAQTTTSSVYSQDNPLYDDLSTGGDPHNRPENASTTTPRSQRQGYRRPSFNTGRMADDDRREPLYVRTTGDAPDSELQTETDGVVYGKAYAVSLNSNGSAENATPKKVRSIPDFRNRDKASRHRAKTLQHVRSLEQMEHKNRNRAATVVPISPVSPVSPISPVFPHKTTQYSESDTGSYNMGPGKSLPYTSYVDQGTDAGVQQRLSKDAGAQANLIEPSVRRSQELPFEPVFPLVEDLVITFLDGNYHHELFESVIQSYKTGSYPPLPAHLRPYPAAGPHGQQQQQQQQQQQPLSDGARLTRYSIMTVETDVELIVHSNANYSHYRDASLASNANSNKMTTPRWPKRKASLTNSPKLISNAQRFLEFYPSNFRTCLGAQDAFRMMLSGNIPTMSLDNVPFTSPLQVYGSWKPVLRTDHGLDSRGRTVDQILAVGYEDGVHKDLYQAIVGQIERLGTKKSGLSKSSHVDARYVCFLYYTTSAQEADNRVPLQDTSSLAPCKA
jgi:hypothetical protein